MKRRLLIRAAAVLFFVALSFFLYNIGKGASLLVDNKTVELGGTTYEALNVVRVALDGGEPIELYPRDRDQINVTGASHRVSVTAYDRAGRETAKRETRIRLSGKSRMYLLSLPAFAGGAEDWVTEFNPE